MYASNQGQIHSPNVELGESLFKTDELIPCIHTSSIENSIERLSMLYVSMY